MVMNHTQHVLSSIVNEADTDLTRNTRAPHFTPALASVPYGKYKFEFAETRRVISLVSGLDNPDLPRHMELYHSNCGDAVTLAMAPSD